MKKIKLLGIAILSFLAVINVYAAGNYVKDKAIEITSENVREFTLDFSTLITDDIKPVGDTKIEERYGEYTPEMGKTYTATYPDALDYFGKTITLKLDIKLIYTYDETNTEKYNQNVLSISDNNRINITGQTTSNATGAEKYQYSTKYEVVYSFYDEERDPFKYTGLIGFIDPDGGNYLFNTDREIYYKDAFNAAGTVKFSEAYLLNERGLERDLEETSAFENAVVYIALTNEKSFKVELDIVSDWIAVPYLYGMVKDFNINYVLKGGTNDEDNPIKYSTGEEITINNPTRDGYDFLGWKEGNKIEKWDFGDKTFTAQWKRTEEIVEVEDTAANKTMYLYLLGTALILTGSYTLYNGRKNKKEV